MGERHVTMETTQKQSKPQNQLKLNDQWNLNRNLNDDTPPGPEAFGTIRVRSWEGGNVVYERTRVMS